MTVIGRAEEFAQIAKQPSSVPWMVESNFGTSSSSPFSCLLRPVRHRRINFAFFLKGKVVTASIASVTCLSPLL
jgi:hypothetical protein